MVPILEIRRAREQIFTVDADPQRDLVMRCELLSQAHA
jgi:hypothetical protein